MLDMFRTRKVGVTASRKAVSEILSMAVARGRVKSKIIPANDVVILKSMYTPGQPLIYRVAYPLTKEKTWEIADISAKELTPFCSRLPKDIGDF